MIQVLVTFFSLIIRFIVTDGAVKLQCGQVSCWLNVAAESEREQSEASMMRESSTVVVVSTTVV